MATEICQECIQYQKITLEVMESLNQIQGKQHFIKARNILK